MDFNKRDILSALGLETEKNFWTVALAGFGVGCLGRRGGRDHGGAEERARAAQQSDGQGRDLMGRAKECAQERKGTARQTPPTPRISRETKRGRPPKILSCIPAALSPSGPFLASPSSIGGASAAHAAEDAQLGLGAQLELAHALAARCRTSCRARRAWPGAARMWRALMMARSRGSSTLSPSKSRVLRESSSSPPATMSSGVGAVLGEQRADARGGRRSRAARRARRRGRSGAASSPRRPRARTPSAAGQRIASAVSPSRSSLRRARPRPKKILRCERVVPMRTGPCERTTCSSMQARIQ